MPAVTVPMVGAPGTLPATAVWLGAAGDPDGRVDRAQLLPTELSELGSTSSSDEPLLASGHPAPPYVRVSAVDASARVSVSVSLAARSPV